MLSKEQYPAQLCRLRVCTACRTEPTAIVRNEATGRFSVRSPPHMLTRVKREDLITEILLILHVHAKGTLTAS
jgi:hypothetical protein